MPGTLQSPSPLDHALATTADVPFYERADWQAALTRPAPRLEELPRITKGELRAHSPHDFLPRRFDLAVLEKTGAIEEESTSGTSGASVRVIFGRTWWVEIDLFDAPWSIEFPQHGCFRLHDDPHLCAVPHAVVLTGHIVAQTPPATLPEPRPVITVECNGTNSSSRAGPHQRSRRRAHRLRKRMNARKYSLSHIQKIKALIYLTHPGDGNE